MQSSLRIGRFGPLTVNLHYTWLLVAVLGLWWLALLWLPATLPGRATSLYWFLAIVVMCLFIVSVILHELAHAVVARSGKRNLILYPFGAGSYPFRQQDVQDRLGKAIVASLAGPAFSIALGAAFLMLGGLFDHATGMLEVIKALALPLGWLNLWLGLVHLIPGIPFDMGHALSATLYWFTGDRETAVQTLRTAGELATLGLALAAAWIGIATESWLDALALITVAWAAREASTSVKQRGLLRDALQDLRVGDVMEKTGVKDVVQETATVAAMVRSHPHDAPDTPMAVVNEERVLKGIVTLSAADNYLQGAWSSTPIHAVMTSALEAHALDSDAPLAEAVSLIEQQPGPPLEQPAIPVMDDGNLVGSLDPAKLDVFEKLDIEAGTEAAVAHIDESSGQFSRFGKPIAVVIVIALMAILGSIALHTNPYTLQGMSSAIYPTITFSRVVPPEDTSIDSDNARISVDMVGARAIVTAMLSLDGRFLPVRLEGPSPLEQTVSAQADELTLGLHTVQVTASTVSGQLARVGWKFTVETPSQVQGQIPISPVPSLGAGVVQVVSQIPPSGGATLSSTTGLDVGVKVKAAKPLRSAQIFYDGQPIESKVMYDENASGGYTGVMGVAPTVTVGEHSVRVQIAEGENDLYTTEWTFKAIEPDENNVYFKETGQFVSQPFLKYWQDNGGLAVFGYPISDRLRETDLTTTGGQQGSAPTGGESYTAQYFERARFELHPSTGDKVILGRLGALTHDPEQPAKPLPGAAYFPETGHNLSGSLLDYWNAHGGLALFGYPITEELFEKNPSDGREYRVQYFERARFELHPEFAGTPFEVQLGQLGAQLYSERSVSK